jgi:excisionase family DNA binding protein
MEMAKRMDVSARTIETWMRRRKVPFEKIGRTVRFHWGDARNYLFRHSRVEAQPLEPARLGEGVSPRLKNLAASIRRRERMDRR